MKCAGPPGAALLRELHEGSESCITPGSPARVAQLLTRVTETSQNKHPCLDLPSLGRRRCEVSACTSGGAGSLCAIPADPFPRLQACFGVEGWSWFPSRCVWWPRALSQQFFCLKPAPSAHSSLSAACSPLLRQPHGGSRLAAGPRGTCSQVLGAVTYIPSWDGDPRPCCGLLHGCRGKPKPWRLQPLHCVIGGYLLLAKQASRNENN